MKQSTKDAIVGILCGLLFGMIGVAVLDWWIARKTNRTRQ